MPFIPLAPAVRRPTPADFPMVSPDQQDDRDADAERIVAEEFQQDMPDVNRAALESEYRQRFGKEPPDVQRGFVPLANAGERQPARGFVPLAQESEPSPQSGVLRNVLLNNPLTAAGEAALNLGSQMVALPVAGLAGLGTETANVLGLTDKTGAEAVHSVGEAMTYQPRGEMGKGAADIAAYPFQKLAEAGNWAGNKTLEATGSPAAATAVDTAINLAPMLIDPATRAAKRANTSTILNARNVDEAIAAAAEVVAAPIELSPAPAFSSPGYSTPLLERLAQQAKPGTRDLINAELERRRAAVEAPVTPDAEMPAPENAMVDVAGNGAATERPEPIPPIEEIPPEPSLAGSVDSAGPWDIQRNAYGNQVISGSIEDIRALDTELRQTGIPIIRKPNADGTMSLLVSTKVDAVTLKAALDAIDTRLQAERGNDVRGFIPKAEALPEAVAPSDVVQNSYAPGANHVGLIGDIRSPVDIDPTGPRAKPITREEVLSPLLEALDATIYQGRVKGKDRLGYYRPKLEEVRIKRMGDIEVAAHEIAHLLDDRIPEIKKAWLNDKPLRDELRSISYDPKKTNEGFAEGMRLYLTQPEALEAKAPKVYAWLESLAQNHEYGPALKRAQEGMTAWFAQDGINRARSKIGKPLDLNAAFDGMWDRFRQSVSDDLHGVYRMERDLTGQLSPVGAYESARLSRASQSISDGAIRNGYPFKKPDGSFTYKGKGLEEILRPLASNLDDSLLYFVGKSAAELQKQGREHLFTPGEIDAMQQLRTPERDAAFKAYQVWNQGILDFAEAQGVINPEARAMWQRQAYMPFHRVGTSDGFKGKPGDWSGIKALTGGTENLRDILGNMTANAAQLIDKAVKNEARQKIAALAGEKGGGRFMVKIDAETRPVKIDKAAVLEGLLKTLGIDRAAYNARGEKLPPHVRKMIKALEADLANNPGLMELYVGNQPPAGGNVVAVLNHGKPTWYEVADPILYRALSAIDRPSMPWIVKWLGLPKRIGQATITLTPDFMVANIARDTIMGAVMSRAGFVPIIESLRGMRLRIMNDPIYKDYIANGGGLSSIYLDESKFRAKLEKFYTRQGIDYRTVLDAPEKLLNFVEHLSDAFEMSTRLGEYQKAIANGENPRHAAYLGREVSTDFAMSGDSRALGFMYSTVMFLRPAVLSLDRLYRGLAHDPNKGAIAIKAGMVALMSIGLYLLNRDDPRYQALADFDRDTYWHFFVGNQHFRYPKIWEIGAMASVAERSVEKIVAADPLGLGKDFARIVGQTFGLNYRPQIIAPLIEQAANRNDFTNAPIETPGMENTQPFLRAKPGTSETLKAAGMATRNLPEGLQVNPVRAEALLRGYFNTWALYGLALSDKAFFSDKMPAGRTDQLPVVRRFYSQEPPQHTRYETEFYDMLSEAKRLTGTLHELDKIGRPDIADEKEKSQMAGESQPLEHAAKNLQGINQEMRMVQRSAVTPDEKRQKLDALMAERNALLKDVVTEAKTVQEGKRHE